MPSICLIQGKYRALVRKAGHKPISKRFDKEADAWEWALKTEREIEAGLTVVKTSETVASRIIKYREMREAERPIDGRSSEHHLLNSIERSIGGLAVQKLTVDELVGWVRRRREGVYSTEQDKKAKRFPNGFTCYIELSKLRVVLRHTGNFSREVFDEATKKLAHFRLIDTATSRVRRPTDDELGAICLYLADTKGQIYADIVRFAAITAMRRGEITALRWDDLDHAKKMVLIRDRKDPVKKIGNDQWVPLLGESWAIVMAQPKEKERIFPVVKQTVTSFFVQACQALDILDLHFHDLRHEGISRLFEAGYQIPQVAVVSGHRDWKMLKRYVQLRPEDLHDGPHGMQPVKSPTPVPGKSQSTPQRPGNRPSGGRPRKS